METTKKVKQFDAVKMMRDKTADTYTCPAGQTLATNGSWYNKDRGKSIKSLPERACTLLYGYNASF